MSKKFCKESEKGDVTKLKKIKDTDAFFRLVNKCSGNIELVSKEGDCINLKSTLAQVLCLTNVFSNEQLLSELELIVKDSDDEAAIRAFLNNQ